MDQKKTRRTATNAERDLWVRTMTAVQPLARRQGLIRDDTFGGTENYQDRLLQNQRPAKGTTAKAQQHRGTPPQPSADSAFVTETLPRLDGGSVGGTDRRTAERVRRGRLAIDMRLDLHGLTLDLAHRRLLGFLSAAQASGARCVLVITGKGTRADGGIGRLRSAVPRWLNEQAFRPMVLSVTHARPKDGGEGALYILLRKAQRGRS